MRFRVLFMIFASAVSLYGSDVKIPRGSYRLTCFEISMQAKNLRATCQTVSGDWLETELHDPDGCVGGIENENGKLRCSRNKTAPQGTYLLTCKDVRLRDNTLAAQCKNNQDQWEETSLQDFKGCRTDIENIDGHLRCRATPPGANQEKAEDTWSLKERAEDLADQLIGQVPPQAANW